MSWFIDARDFEWVGIPARKEKTAMPITPPEPVTMEPEDDSPELHTGPEIVDGVDSDGIPDPAVSQ